MDERGSYTFGFQFLFNTNQKLTKWAFETKNVTKKERKERSLM